MGKFIYISIINIFWNVYKYISVKKKMEHFFKGMTQGKGISCKPPNDYMERFQNFTEKVLKNGEFNEWLIWRKKKIIYKWNLNIFFSVIW